MRSQVLPYLRGLQEVAEVHLLTFEGASVESPPPMDETRGLRLYRLSYHKRPNVPAKMLDIATGVVVVAWIALRHRIALFHARSHVAAAVAAIVALVTRTPWVFDMRGFLADEFVEAGAWKVGGLKYQVVRAVERWLLRRSTAIVVLTDRAVDRLRSEPAYAEAVRERPVAVIPCAVDLVRYQDDGGTERSRTLAYIGSVGTWYLLDDMLRFFGRLLEAQPGWSFLIVNRQQQPEIRRAIARAGLPESSVRLMSAEYDEIPGILRGCAAGIVLLREGLSKLGSSPIKLSEYLACGLPVVVNTAVGDAPRLVASARAGVVLGALDDASLQRGAAELVAIVDEGEAARQRARGLAEATYSLEGGVALFRALYGAILAREGRA